MKRHIFCLLAIAPVLLLQGCFFFYIPGSFIDSAADGLSGAQGSNCISSGVGVGGTVRMPNGSSWRVVSIDGTSYRCTQPELPIRAKLEPIP